MTRKEFIISWFQLVKQIVLTSLLLYLIYFIRNSIFIENSSEKSILIFVSISIGLLVILGFIRLILEKVWNAFSERTKTFLNTFSKIMEYISLLFFVCLAYINWDTNKLGIITFGIIILITYTNKIFKQTKQL